MSTYIRVVPEGALVALGFRGAPGTVNLELEPAEARALAWELIYVANAIEGKCNACEGSGHEPQFTDVMDCQACNGTGKDITPKPRKGTK
jgi:hypothetical protein